MKQGSLVRFTGYGYRRAITYRYSELFGDKVYRVKETRKSCCNTFLILEGIEGMYSEKFFTEVPPYPPYIPF